MNKLIFLFSLILVHLSAQDSLELEIIMPKNVFITGELVEIGLYLKNIGNNLISFETTQGYRIIMVNSKGKELKHAGHSHIDFGETIRKKEIKPGEEYYNIVDINFMYGTRFSGLTVDTYFEPDTYTISIKLFPNTASEILREIKIKVVEPEGEEKIIFDTWTNAFLDLPTGKYKGKREELANELYSLIDNYPESVYAPILLNFLGAWYGFILKNNTKRDELHKKLIENYTWSVKARSRINQKLNKLSTKSERVDFLNSLKINTINSVMEKFIEMKLHNEINN